MNSLRDAANALADLETTIYGVSLDDVVSLKKFADDEELEFALLSDPDGSVAAKYQVLGRGGVWAQRVTFILDDTGTIRHIDREVNVSSHGEDLAKVLEALMNE